MGDARRHRGHGRHRLGANPAVLVVAVILQGMGNEMYNVSSAPFMMENSGERERTTLFSASFGLNTLAGFAGSLVGGQLPRLMSGAFALTPDTAPVYGAALLFSPALYGVALLPLLGMREPPRPTWRRRWAWPNRRLMALKLDDGWARVQGRAGHCVAWTVPPAIDRQAADAQRHHQPRRGVAHSVHERLFPRAASRAR